MATLWPWRGKLAASCGAVAARAEIKSALRSPVAALVASGRLRQGASAPVALAWPLAVPSSTGLGVHGISNFVDQNPAFPNQVLDYNCGGRSYDLASGYNHQGIDIFLWPWAWNTVDADTVQVVPAAPGTIISKQDGNFARHCSLSGGQWNAVYVQHADGSVAWYGHLKKNSLTAKAVGQTVSTGEYLGVVGSSGNSTGPHLHLDPPGN